MKAIAKGSALAGVGVVFAAEALWAHPGHVTHGDLWHTVAHVLASSYHVAVVVAAVVLAVAWFVAVRPARAARRAARAADEGSL